MTGVQFRAVWVLRMIGFAALAVASLTACGDTGPGDASGGSSSAAGNSGSSATGGSEAEGGNGAGGSGSGGTSRGGTSTGSGGVANPASESFPIGFGVPELFISQLTRPVRLGIKDGALYFTEMGLADGSLSRLARRNPAGDVQTLFTGNTVAALFLDDDELFFVERGTHSVFRMKYATPTPELFASTPATLTVGDVARLGESMWMTEFGSDGMTTAIVKQGRAGGSLEDLLPATTRGFIFTYLTVAAGQIYISTQTGAGVFKGSTSGAPVLSIPSVVAHRLGADASHVYFGSQNDGRIQRQAHTANMSPEPFADSQNQPFAVTVDSGGVYWTNGPDCNGDTTVAGSVVAKSLAGGAIVNVATGERCPQAIVTDAEFVYWIRENPADGVGDDVIMRAKKLR